MRSNVEAALLATAQRYAAHRTCGSWDLHVAVVSLWLLAEEQAMMAEAA